VNETQVLLNAVAALPETGRAALATVVKVTGSAYRGPGARLLIRPDGSTVGAVSAGCLERDLVERAQRVLASEAPALAIYDTSDLGENVWGLGIGCGGTVEVLIEPVHAGTPAARLLAFLGDRVAKRDTGVAAVVFRATGLKVAVGSRLMQAEGQPIETGISDPPLVAWLRNQAEAAHLANRSAVTRYVAPTGSADVFIEAIAPPLPLAVFGAGDDALPLVQLADTLGWDVTLVDSRAGLAHAGRFPAANRIVIGQPDQVWDRVTLSAKTAAVVMTHNYAHDLSIVRRLLGSPVRYLGILGTRKRTAAMLRSLAGEGVLSAERVPAHVHAPIGMDIGAETPAEIALAVAAEVQAVCAGRGGGFLKARQGSIHDRE
jgi:xanthine dehydrogenase accessory factor